MGWRKYYWLNLQEMCSRLIRPHQELVKVRYFTARINQAAEEKRRRQLTYLEALETLPLVDIHYGLYLASPQTCLKCGHTFIRHSEKKSDVNIAVKLITDAMEDLYDSAVLISADSDLTPAVDAIKKYFLKHKISQKEYCRHDRKRDQHYFYSRQDQSFWIFPLSAEQLLYLKALLRKTLRSK